jgi:hypothetical protein
VITYHIINNRKRANFGFITFGKAQPIMPRWVANWLIYVLAVCPSVSDGIVATGQDLVVTPNATWVDCDLARDEVAASPFAPVAYYYRACLLYVDVEKSVPREEIDALVGWTAAKLEELPIIEARNLLGRLESDQLLVNLAEAARSNAIQWPWSHHSALDRYFFHETWEYIPLRTIASVVDVQSRIGLVNGDYEASLRQLRIHFALAAHLSSHPDYLISNVGVGIAEHALETAAAFIQWHGSPNLYRFLTEIAGDFPNSRLVPSVSARKDFFCEILPPLRRLENEIAESDFTVLKESVFELVDSFKQVKRPSRSLLDHKIARELSPDSRNRLIHAGFATMDVDSMPDLQVVCRDYLSLIRSNREKLTSLMELNEVERNTEIVLLSKELNRLETTLDTLLTGGFVTTELEELPNFGRRFSNYIAMKRKIEMLRLAESVRFHTSFFNGRVPASLQELSELTVPSDPFEGRPFGYAAKGRVVEISSPVSDTCFEEHSKAKTLRISIRE